MKAMGSLPILPDLAKTLNSRPDSASAIPRRPAQDSSRIVSFRCQDLVMAWLVVVCPDRVFQNSAAAADLSAAPLVDFADPAVADCSSPVADPGSFALDPDFVAGR